MWSVDSALKSGLPGTTEKRDKSPRELIGNVASAAFIYQIMTMYMISTFHKTGLEWYELNTASFWALRLKYFVTPLGDFLAGHPDLLQLLTWAVLRWEFFGPLLFVSPFCTAFLRLFAVFGFMVLHISFGLCLRLGFFTFITNTALMALLPGEVWDLLHDHVWATELRKSSTVVYSTDSYFSAMVAYLARHFLLLNDTTFVPLAVCAKRSSVDPESPYKIRRTWLKVRLNRGHGTTTNSLALVNLLCYLCPITSLISWYFASFTHSPSILAHSLRSHRPLRFIPLNLIALFDYAANLLHELTQTKYVSHPPSALRRKSSSQLAWKNMNIQLAFFLRRIMDVFLVWMIICILGQNLNHVGYSMGFPPKSSHWLIYATRTDQRWNMFAPHPPHKSFWYVIPGKLMDQSSVELWRNGGTRRLVPSLSRTHAHFCSDHEGDLGAGPW